MTYVKICGLTNLEDALVAAEAGADFLGFIFYVQSPRAVTPEQVKQITAGLPPYVQTVGVFINESIERITQIRQQTALAYIQLHGDEPPEMVRAIRGAYKAIRPANADQVRDIAAAYTGVEGLTVRLDSPELLIDTYHPELKGGTGQQMSRDIALQAQKHTRRLMLAGGLTPENVAEVVREVRPWAVDVSSGVEAVPGKKDHGKVRAFIQAVRETDRLLYA